MRARRKLVFAGALGVALGLGACARTPTSNADTRFGVERLSSGSAVEFHRHAEVFYQRLLQRRFNTLTTYQDRVLREYFHDEVAYADYYANLAQALASAHFERSRPRAAEIQEFVFESPGRARVRVRLAGEHGLPLRWWKVALEREDRWERSEGRWWLLAGKL